MGGGICRSRDQIDLVGHQERIGSGPGPGTLHLFGAPRVEDKKPDLGFFRALQGTSQPFLLDDIVAVAQPGGIGKDHRVALEVDRDLDDVPRGAGDRRGDNRVPFCYPIEKTRFSGIWRADDRNHDAVSQPFAAMPVSEVTRDLGDELLGLTEYTILDFAGQVLIGKIDGRFEMRENARQAVAPALVEAAELAVELAERLAALHLGLGCREIGNGFSLQQIELAVEKGAAGKLAGLGEPQSKLAQHLHDSSKHGATAVHMKLCDIFPGDAARRRKP